jgi:hypothetical protein
MLPTRKRQPKSKLAKSNVSNGTRLFLRVPGDNRTSEARRFRDIFDQLCVDAGGWETLSEGQIQLARRCALISIKCETLEAESMVNDGRIDLELYGKLTDRLGRCLQRLGIKRTPRDVTPTLAEYIEHINETPD